MPGLVKIGMTALDDPDQRANQLYTTGVPLPFEVHYSAKVANADDIEAALHNAFRDKRLNPRREFFEIEPDQAIGILKLFDLEETTEQLRNTFDKDVSSSEQNAVQKAKRRRPQLNFEDMGIPIGAQLTFVRDEDITALIAETKKVNFEGEIQSLTALTTDLLNLDYNVQPTQYWMYEGSTLTEIYNQTYVTSDY